MSHEELTYAAGKAMGAADERERIAKWLETHSVDWDCSILVFDEDDYDADYCEWGGEPNERKADACSRRALADCVRNGS